MDKVTVLMSTYNGEKYIRQQIDSILSQEGVLIKLIIRDDCSSDTTPSILKEYAEKNENVSFYIGSEKKGACRSFFELMSRNYDSNFYALSDQDDVWDKNKLITAIHNLKSIDADIPALYYSNLRIVDEKMNFIRNSHVKPMVPGAKFSYLADVFVTGCTAVFNKSLQNIAVEIRPKDFSMHDTWLYIVASIFGKTIYDFTPHINYRQHGSNVIGTRKKRFGIKSLRRELHNYLNWKDQPRLKCAKVILKQFNSKLDILTREKLEEFIHYKESIGKTFKLAFDNDLNSENRYRKLRFRITVLLRNA